MKELASVSGNHFAKYDESGNLVPTIEVVINTTEPVYRLSPDGEIIKRRDAFTIRFVTDPESLRNLADTLHEQARISESSITAAMSTQVETPKYYTQEGSGMFWRWKGKTVRCLELGKWVPSHFSSPDDIKRVLGNIKEVNESDLPTGKAP